MEYDAASGQANRNKMIFVGLCLLVFFVSFLTYANTLTSDFIWDDEYLILNNSQIKTFAHLGNVFKTYVGYGSENINNFYRPIQEIANMTDYFLWGEYPLGYHLTNVLLHSFVSVMVLVFFLQITGDRMASALGALFYAVHPVHSEAVAYIAGRADSLYALFMLISLALFVQFSKYLGKDKKAGSLYVWSVFFFIVSLLSKEIILSMPLIIYAYVFFFVRGIREDSIYKKLRWSWVPYAVVVVIYGVLRSTVLDFSDIAPGSVFVKFPLMYRLITFIRVIFTYIRLMVFPIGLHMERTITISRSIADPSAIAAVLFIIAIGYAVYYTYKRSRLISFCIAWFFINLLPVSNIVPINSFLAEHWIYMASAGPFLLVGIMVARAFKRLNDTGYFYAKFVLIIVVGIIIGNYARMTAVRNMDWKDELSFFKSTLKYHPKNARLYLNMGNTYYEQGDIEEAITQYKRAIDINRDYAVAYGNIGSARLHTGNIDEAEKYLAKALSIKDNYPIAHYNLGIVYFQKGKYKPCIKELEKATRQLPQLYQAWNMLGRAYLKEKDVPRAKNAFQRSLEIMPRQDGIQKILEKMP